MKADVNSKRNSKAACKRLFVGLSLSVFSASIAAAPAQAQFPYWYLGIGQSLLYPLTRGFGLPYLGGPYSANPFFSYNSYLKRAAGRASQFPYIYPYNPSSYSTSGYRNGGLPAGYPTQDPGDGMVDPNTGRTLDPDDPRSPAAQAGSAQGAAAPNFYLPGPQTQYQTLYGQPNQAAMPPQPGALPQSSQAAPGQLAPTQGISNPYMPNQVMPGGAAQPMQTDANGQPVILSDPNSMPPKAPKHGRNKSKSAKASKNDNAVSPAVPPLAQPYLPSAPGTVTNVTQAGVSSSGAAGSPLADGFVDHLVKKYDGHMGNALNNADTRNWAKAMGVIDDQHSVDAMPADRIEVMGRILKDSSLDSVSKVDAVRILLKQKAAAK
jgi:hypothetical protein